MRLLIVSDSPALESGQARVVREIAKRFHQSGLDVQVAGWFHAIAKTDRVFPYPVTAASKEHPESLGPILAHLKPDVVLAFGDPWDFRWLAKVRVEQGGFRLVGYLNVEAAPLPPHLEQVLDSFDALATTSQYGAAVIGRPGISAIHHGVNLETFFPTEKPDRMFDRDLKQTFVVLVNGQNTFRKNLRAAVGGVARFARGRSDVLCYVNSKATPGADDPSGQNLLDLVVQYGVQKVVCFNPQNCGPRDTVGDDVLNRIYGIADALLISSMSEGFGLAVLEAMATNTVVVAPDAYSMPELLADGRGVLYPVNAWLRGDQGTDMAVVTEEDIASALEQVYERWRQGDLEDLHQAGREFAQASSWDATVQGLLALIERPPKETVATGQSIDPYLRLSARQAGIKYPGAVGVLKMGGLGDMLQATVVVRAAARKYKAKVVVFCNGHHEVFEAMPEVAHVVQFRSMPQDQALRSVADQFGVFLDVRYVSMVYGDQPTAYSLQHRWFYDAWTQSCERLDTLGLHSTEVMLTSLGLLNHADSIRPIFDPRDPAALDGTYLAVSTGVGAIGGLKKWPAESWEVLVRTLNFQGVTLVQVGGEDDDLVPGAIDYRGASLARTASILAGAAVLVAVEGGMVHLASATMTPAVVLFGPTPVEAFAYPWHQSLSSRECRPCWWSLPMWTAEMCAMGRNTCANHYDVDRVLAILEPVLAATIADRPLLLEVADEH